MKTHGPLSPLGEMVRRIDPDRYLTALFAPPARREALFTLYAVNHELARAREVVREPFAALIRLQWWREVVEGARRNHEIATPLGAALDAGQLDPAELERMIAARETEAEGFETLEDFQAYAMAAAGGLMVAAGRALGWDGAEALRHWGAAYGIAGMLRSLDAHARQGRCLLPLDLIRNAGSSAGAVIANPHDPSLAPVRDRLSELARSWAATSTAPPRLAVAAALPIIFARRDLARSEGTPVRPWWDKVMVAKSGLTGSV